MYTYCIKTKNRKNILALGAESDGNFSVFCDGIIYYSNNFGNLIDESNFIKLKQTILNLLQEKNIKPDIIASDLHPLFKTTELAKELSKKFNSKHIKVQHHIAHIFSSIGEQAINNGTDKISNNIFGIAMDGTGYGLNDKIWGGEIFKISNLSQSNTENKVTIKRIGRLENQILLGGELAIKEPARVIIAILNNFLGKDEIYKYVGRHYAENEFNLLHSQLQQNFNCQKTSSTGRILDAVSVLLGFSKNERKYKHQAINILEQNSTNPYNDLNIKILNSNNKDTKYIINTTHLFKYLIKNIKKDKKRLASTAQHYISDCFCKVIDNENKNKNSVFASGGITNNKIILQKLKDDKIITNNKIPCGDNGISIGQIFYSIFNE